MWEAFQSAAEITFCLVMQYLVLIRCRSIILQ